MTKHHTPTVPIIDENTKLSFMIKSLNDSLPIQDLNSKVTITDHDDRCIVRSIGISLCVDHVYKKSEKHHCKDHSN